MSQPHPFHIILSRVVIPCLAKNLLLFLFFVNPLHAEVYPSLGTSVAVTPNSETSGGGSEIFYDLSGMLDVELSKHWTLFPSYALGLNTIGSSSETFSMPALAFKYQWAELWAFKPALSLALSHGTGYRSQKVKLGFIHAMKSPQLTFSFGPSFFRDNDATQKLGLFGTLSGIFTEKWFWYGGIDVARKVTYASQLGYDFSILGGTGYEVTDQLSFSFDLSFFQGRSGLALNRQRQFSSTTQVAQRNSKSSLLQKNNALTSQAVILTLAADYNF